MVFKIEVTFFGPILFLFNDIPSNGPSDWKFSKASSKDNRSLFVFLCKKQIKFRFYNSLLVKWNDL
jgi:hypothetical protein